MKVSNLARGSVRYGLAAALLTSVAPSALHAETSNAELAKEIAELKAQIRALRGSVAETRKEVRHAPKSVAVALPPPAPPIPYGATPVFVTADNKMRFGALTITPGGFIAMESAFRSRTTQSDIATQFNGIPFGPQGATNETRFSARQSRFALLAEAPISENMLVSGYFEGDFLGSGTTSNSNESNSYLPRVRHLYATLDNNEYGLHVLAGQTWSLATMNSKGITPRNEVTPPQIDAQYIPGFVWKRVPEIRLTKDFDKRLWVSLSAEASQNVFTGCNGGINNTAPLPAPGGVQTAVTCDLPGTNALNGAVNPTNGIAANGIAANAIVAGSAAVGAGTYDITNFSLNHVPDVVGKVAYEAKFADRDIHIEGFGIYRDLYDRVSFATAGGGAFASNTNTTGYGIGGGLIVPAIPKKLDLQVSGLWGRGIGTYGTSQLTDATFNANGSLAAIPEQMLLAGGTFHATPSIDIYAFGGIEQQDPKFYATNAAGTAFAGYGVPTANNTGCFNYATAGTCAGANKRIYQGTIGFWDKLYKGNFGEVRVGAQYSYTVRELFPGNGGLAAGQVPYSPRQNENIVLTSLRYYPFQTNPVAAPPVVAKY